MADQTVVRGTGEGAEPAGEAWQMVIGLEVHCELKTKTKLFCSCRNAFGDTPNTNICPVCLGLPGSLPVLNSHAVELAIRIGKALGCEVRPSIFARKNYFYPDMPKDYQVSQYDQPINVDGELELPDGTRIGIERAHMEEDTGKNTHAGATGRIHGADYSLIDYNRAGVPLVEIVSRPELTTAEQARQYVAELRSILVAVDASDGKMEEGSLRVDANVSVHRPAEPLGTRCEIKNLNSLRSLGRAIDYEARRQIELLEAGDRVVQETRHWDEGQGRTVSGRSKEEAYDYRYFPEPDLVPLAPDAAWVSAVKSAQPMLPAERRRRLAAAAGVRPADVATVVELDLDTLVLAAIAAGAEPKRAVDRAANEVAADLDAARAHLTPDRFTRLLAMETDGIVTATQAKQVLKAVLAGEGEPDQIADARNLKAMDTAGLEQAVDAVIAAHPAEFERLRGGDPKMTGFFIGQIMKATSGQADGKTATALLRQRAGTT